MCRDCNEILFFSVSSLAVKFSIDLVGPSLIYDDAGTGANRDFSCYSPNSVSPGQYIVGHFGIGSHRDGRKPTPYVMSVNTEHHEIVFKRPTDYQQIWNDTGSEGIRPGSIWSINCPTGFASVSDLCQAGYKQPRLDAVWCINDRFLENDLHDKWIWDSNGSNSDADVDIRGGSTNWTKELISATTGWGLTKNLTRIRAKFFLDQGKLQCTSKYFYRIFYL